MPICFRDIPCNARDRYLQGTERSRIHTFVGRHVLNENFRREKFREKDFSFGPRFLRSPFSIRSQPVDEKNEVERWLSVPFFSFFFRHIRNATSCERINFQNSFIAPGGRGGGRDRRRNKRPKFADPETADRLLPTKTAIPFLLMRIDMF